MDPLTIGLLFAAGAAALEDDSEVDTLAGSAPAYSGKIQAFAQAIATAEGFYKPGSIPQRAHNPGNLVIPGWTGDKLGSEGISVFGDDGQGWARLYSQLNLIVTGRTRAGYTLDMTIAEMGAKWAPGGAANITGAWANNVARVLGVPVTTRLRDVLT
jgi:hypothetical protein